MVKLFVTNQFIGYQFVRTSPNKVSYCIRRQVIGFVAKKLITENRVSENPKTKN